MKKVLNNSGFSMIELVVSIGVMAIAILAVVQLTGFADKRSKDATEDIQLKILQLGAEKFINTDIANSFGGFNYLNVNDDDDKWFYGFNREFVCQEEACSRTLTLKLNDSETVSSKMLYLIVVKGKPGEKLVFEVPPSNVFNDDGNYRNMNNTAVINHSFSKTNLEYSPWESGRLLLLRSNISMYDCLNGIISTTTSCNFSCSGGPSCNQSTKRKFKMLGVVSSNEQNLQHYSVSGQPNLFNSKLKACRKDSSGGCSAYVDFGASGNFGSDIYYNRLPYLAGFNNNTSFQPVELVRYSLRRNGASSSNKFTTLVRESATFQGGRLKFTKSFKVLVGLESIVFKRKSISSPTISYKINKLSRYN